MENLAREQLLAKVICGLHLLITFHVQPKCGMIIEPLKRRGYSTIGQDVGGVVTGTKLTLIFITGQSLSNLSNYEYHRGFRFDRHPRRLDNLKHSI